ncbi:MAG: preprotein translocase subunit TatC [Coriobacteriia bacterium]|nr:preprotein translocase subunit TatC [Coriobacteriia bacterium]
MSHIGELRHRFLVIAVTIAFGSVIAYSFTPDILGWLFAPVYPYLPGDHSLVVLSPFEAFMFRFRVASYAAIVLTSPIWVWQVLAFFLPALEEKERKFFYPSFVAIVALFVGGNLFCHYFVVGPSFAWLIGQANGGVDVSQLLYTWFHIGSGASNAATTSLSTLPSAAPFLNGVLVLMVAFGITFELPVLLFFLMSVGLVKYATMRKNWRFVYLGLITFGSLATPDWSPVTIGTLIGALIILYEATMLIAKYALAAKIKQQAIDAAESA